MSSLQKARSHLERLGAVSRKLAHGVELARLQADPEARDLAYEGLGARLQAAYTGFETLIEMSLACRGTEIPRGESSHQALLDAALRCSLVTAEEKLKLEEIKGFRHIHRHVYDLVIDPKILDDRALAMAEILPGILFRVGKILAEAGGQDQELPLD
ncbi:MAG: hypothetical protein J0I10_11260 [Verrucomicrobia bacterium]|nr:hypothetical protein [Verrucomicrobiota bacterium]